MIRSYLLNKILPGLIFIVLLKVTFNGLVKNQSPVYKYEAIEFIDHTYDSIIGNIDSFLLDALEKGNIPGGAIVIVKDNQILFRKCYGVKAYGKKDSIDIHTVFRLGSVSKGFASVLAGTLIMKNQMRWDDTVKNILPGFEMDNEEYEQQLTVRHILSHTTGFPVHAYTNLLDDGVPYEKIKPLLCSIPLIGPPGKYYSYQNVAYSLISDIMEVKTGDDYSTLLKKNLFTPLGMKDASSDFQSINSAKNVAKPHVKLKNGKWLTEKQNIRYYSVGPAAGVNASVADMGMWLKALLGYNPQTLDSALLNEIFTPQIRCNTIWKYKRAWKKLKRVHYGLGWRIFEYDDKKVVFHSGYVRGYKAEVALIPEDKLGVAVLFNGASNTESYFIPKFIDEYLTISTELTDTLTNNNIQNPR